jgi:prophage antirepressor-like protein
LETQTVPKDSNKLYDVWERSNKDGSRDKRFAENRQLPVMEYGEITFTSESGIYEKYMISNCSSAEKFVRSILNFTDQLNS